jgi:putative sterol carrier protein
MPVDIKKMFNEELPAALLRNADEAKSLAAKFQIEIAGEGDWHIDASATGPACKAGKDTADCTIKIDAESFQTLMEDPANNGMKLFFAGKLKVDGNQMLAMKMQKLFGFK